VIVRPWRTQADMWVGVSLIHSFMHTCMYFCHKQVACCMACSSFTRCNAAYQIVCGLISCLSEADCCRQPDWPRRVERGNSI
jgi:hypothetical protein